MKRSGFKSRGKPMRARSPKRAAYMASQERQDAVAHMMAVKSLGCLVCGAQPAEAHHLPGQRDDYRTIPLCPPHHRTEYGPQAYHYSRPAFNERHGSDEWLLQQTMALLGKE